MYMYLKIWYLTLLILLNVYGDDNGRITFNIDITWFIEHEINNGWVTSACLEVLSVTNIDIVFHNYQITSWAIPLCRRTMNVKDNLGYNTLWVRVEIKWNIIDIRLSQIQEDDNLHIETHVKIRLSEK